MGGGGVKYGISHYWLQPDSESLQSKLTSVTGFSRTASHVESQIGDQSSCKVEPRQLLRLTVLSLKLIAHHGGFSRWGEAPFDPNTGKILWSKLKLQVSMESGNNKKPFLPNNFGRIWFTATFCIFPWKPPIWAEIWWREKNAFIHFSQVDLLTMKVLRANPSQEVFSAFSSSSVLQCVVAWMGWCIVSWYNWIIEPFHQLIPYTIVGQQQNTCPSLYIRAPAGQIPPLCTVQKTPRQSGVDWQEGQYVAVCRGTLASWGPCHW